MTLAPHPTLVAAALDEVMDIARDIAGRAAASGDAGALGAYSAARALCLAFEPAIPAHQRVVAEQMAEVVGAKIRDEMTGRRPIPPGPRKRGQVRRAPRRRP